MGLASLLVVGIMTYIWWARVPYPFDLEWMEGGMLAHAWRLQQGLPLYVEPNPDFMPFIYPPGYSAVLAALGTVFGLSPALGRVVSVLGILTAAGALAFVVRGEGGSRTLATGVAVAFLGAYPASGAFYDMVRPDSLSLALLGWSVALALRTERGAPVASGLLLAAAFLVKHSAAIFGFPLLLGLLVRHRRAALQFVLASAGPALAVVLLLQWRSGGGFLTYLLEVPSSHIMVWERARVHTFRELGTALPAAVTVTGLSVYLWAVRQRQALPLWMAAVLPMAAGIGVAWVGTYYPPPPETGALLVPTALAYWGVTAGVTSFLAWTAGATLQRLYRQPIQWPSWRWIFGLATTGTAVGTAMIMRAHDGGFVNVHMPMIWVVSLSFGVVLAHTAALDEQRPGLRTLAMTAVFAQLLYGAGLLDPVKLRPTAEDEAVGWAFVEAAREVEGPVLSPFASWIPVYADKPPSLHAMAVWDCDYDGSPYEDGLSEIRRAIRERYWVLALGGNHQLLGPLTDGYHPVEEVVTHDAHEGSPKTGYHARPWRLMVPIEGLE